MEFQIVSSAGDSRVVAGSTGGWPFVAPDIARDGDPPPLPPPFFPPPVVSEPVPLAVRLAAGESAPASAADEATVPGEVADDEPAGAQALFNGLVILMIPPVPQYGLYHDAHNEWERATRHLDRNPRKALEEWITVADAIERGGGQVVVLPPHIYSDLGLSDMVFAANHGTLFADDDGWPLFVGARMIHPIRQGESHRLELFWKNDLFSRFAQPGQVWEGQADVSRELPGKKVILTHGVRTTYEANQQIKKYFPPGTEFLDVRILFPFYHGDTCINVVRNKEGRYFVIYHEAAIAPEDLPRLREFAGHDVTFIPISEHDAKKGYVANSLEINGTLLLLRETSEALKETLRGHGFDIREFDLTELFSKGGGGTRCSSLELRTLDQFPTLKARLLEKYRYRRDEWEKLVLTYPTSAREQDRWENYDSRPPALRALPEGAELPKGFEVLDEGLLPGDIKVGLVSEAVPDDVYVTRGNEVALQLDDKRIPLSRPRPGGVIRLAGDKAEVVSIEEVQPGDRLLLEGTGRLWLADRRHEEKGIEFGFMETEVTAERFQEAQILKIAQVMLRLRKEGGKIAFVGGPAISHSDASKYLAALIHAGWIDVLSTGNAFATHDLELGHQEFGTSLGSSPEAELRYGKRAVPRGEQHHLLLINEARRYGSVQALVASGRVSKQSALATALAHGVKVIMTGSIRDDGPLPGVLSNIPEANAQLRDAIHDAGMVIGLGTYLHTAAALMQVPATTAKVLVDVNDDVLRRLQTIQPLNTMPVSSNALFFLEKLCRALGIAVDHLGVPTPMGERSRRRYANPTFDAGDPNLPIQFAEVTQDGVAPGGYRSSTNEPTFLNLGDGRSVQVEGQKMDGVIVYDPATQRATVKVFRHLHKGDQVVVGNNGVRIERITGEETPRDVPAVARKLFELKRAGKPVLLVAGDALVSSDASVYVSELVARGYITRLHSGAALPLYEVEDKLFGTMGKNDVRALARIRSEGGFTGKAFEKLSPDGIFGTAERVGAEIVVSASPNDTGFIQGSIADTNRAEDAIREIYSGTGLVICAASVLHSVAAGNMGEGTIPVVVVDKNRFAIGKLADRGTVQAHGFEMDVGEFFHAVWQEVKRLEEAERGRGPGNVGQSGLGDTDVDGGGVLALRETSGVGVTGDTRSRDPVMRAYAIDGNTALEAEPVEVAISGPATRVFTPPHLDPLPKGERPALMPPASATGAFMPDSTIRDRILKIATSRRLHTTARLIFRLVDDRRLLSLMTSRRGLAATLEKRGLNGYADLLRDPHLQFSRIDLLLVHAATLAGATDDLQRIFGMENHPVSFAGVATLPPTMAPSISFARPSPLPLLR